MINLKKRKLIKKHPILKNFKFNIKENNIIITKINKNLIDVIIPGKVDNYNILITKKKNKLTEKFDSFIPRKAETLKIEPGVKAIGSLDNFMHRNKYIKQIEGLENLDTTEVTSMVRMFARSNISDLNVATLKTSNVQDMSHMFSALGRCKKIEGLENLDTSNVINFEGMFTRNDIESINVKSFNTQKAINMQEMFAITNIKEIDLSNFDTINVKNMKFMFGDCPDLKEVIGLENLNISNVESMLGMFYECYRLKTLDISKLNFKNLKNLEMLNYTNYHLNLKIDENDPKQLEIAKLTEKLKKIDDKIENHNFKTQVIDLNLFNYEIINNEYILIKGVKEGRDEVIIPQRINELPVKITTNGSNFFHVENKYIKIEPGVKAIGELKNFLNENKYVEKIEGLENLDVSEVTNVNYCFSNNENLKELNLENWNLNKVIEANSFIKDNNKLIKLNIKNMKMDNVENLNFAFASNFRLEKIEGLETFNPKNAKIVSNMFYELKALKELNLASFEGSMVEDAHYMCIKCYSLEDVNIEKWNPKNLIDMGGMFNECFNLKNIKLFNYPTPKLEKIGLIFDDCINLETIDFGKISTDKIKEMILIVTLGSLKELNISSFNCESLNQFELSSYKINGDKNINLIINEEDPIQRRIKQNFIKEREV